MSNEKMGPMLIKINIPNQILTKWQANVNLLSDIIKVPAALIMKAHPHQIEVFVSSDSKENPYKKGEKENLNTGLYCETVMKTLDQLLVPNALKDLKWKNNPSTQLGMLSYLGSPLLWPNGEVFGTVCVLDNKENNYSKSHQELISFSKNIIEEDLKTISEKSEFYNKLKNRLLKGKASLNDFNIRTNKLLWPNGEQFGTICILDDEQKHSPSDQGLLPFLKELIEKGMIIILEDAEQYSKIVDKLMKSEDSLAEAQRIARLGNWDWDIEKDKLLWSDEIYRIFGLRPQEFGATYEAFLNTVHPGDKELVRKAVEDALNGKEYKIDHYIVLPDGSERFVHQQAKAYYKEGKAVRMIGTVQDITERKTLEDKLLQSEKLSALGELIGGIAHDFNNQLNIIFGFGQLIEQLCEPDSTMKEYASDIIEASDNSMAIIRQLLDFAGKGKIESIPIDVNDLINQVIEFLEISLDKKIKIKKKYDEISCVVYGDPRQLQNALLNLSINARDAMPDGGCLCFKTKTLYLDEDYCKEKELTPGNYVNVIVRDTGTGIDEKILNNIFEPFFTTKKEGTGLGLASVYGIVKGHKGWIEVESKTTKPNRGTKFGLYFPCLDERLPAEIDTAVIKEGEGNILVVDDSEKLRDFTVDSLHLLKYTAHAVSGGNAAVDYLKENKDSVDLVILDMNMEGMDGNQTAKLLREIKPKIKILLSTGYMNIKPERTLFNDVLQKPFKIEELSQKVYKIIN